MTKDKKYYVGKSNGLELSEGMFNCVKNGTIGYLTNGFFKRAEFDISAVLCVLETYYNQDKYRDIDDKLN